MFDRDEIARARALREAWEAGELRAFLDRQPESRPEYRTLSGLPLKRVYTAEDLADFRHDDLGLPGQYPYTRGPYPTMYRGRTWTMRQIAGFGTGEDTNGRFRYLIEQGQTGLSVDFDMPTLMGYDSDDPRALGEVGREGVAVDTLDDVEALFGGVDLERISVSMTINPTAWILLAMYVALAQGRGLDLNRLSGTVQADILKEYIAQKEWAFPIRPSMRIMRDMIVWSARNMARYNPINISGYHISEAGATSVQELAFTMANAVAYVEEVTRAGVPVDEFAPRLAFYFVSQNDFFEEIAKFRAARRIYARLMKERFGARNPKSMMFRTLIGGGGSGFTVQEPENNIVRGAYYALAAALSGAQTMALPTYDEAYTIPSSKAQLVALRTMQICAEETGVADTVDPLAGSYFVESLTNEMEARIREEMDRVDRMGGVIEGVKSGAIQAEVARQAYRFEQMMLSGEYPKVGVNRHLAPDAERESSGQLELYAFDATVAEAQVAKLARLRRDRDAATVGRALGRLQDEARGTANLMPAIVEAVRAYATLGEMAGALREVWGEHKEPLVF